MANTVIKITQLPNIGNNLGANTLLPVVDTTGTAVTDKVTVGNVANFILSEAGNLLPTAFTSELALDVVNGAQPNITSLGNLTGLTITNLANLNIPGGENGYVLQTNGNGNLDWTAMAGSGDGNPGGANTQIQFNNSGLFDGDISLTWDSANAQLNTVNFAASEATIYGNVNAVDVLATGNVVPNAIYTDNYFYANGAPFSGGGGNPFDQDLNTTDNVQFANVTSTDAIRFSNSGNIVGAIGYSPTSIDINSYQSNTVTIITNDVNIWTFGSDGVLSFPGNTAESSGNVLIDPTDDNFEVRGAQSVNFEANAVVNIYTDTSNNAYQWQFGDDGNLTLPTNNSSINYANGSPYGGGGGGSGYIIPYEVATFVANTRPGFGEIQFASNEGGNSAPSTAQKLFINESPTNEQSMGTIFQQWTSNSYRGTLSLNNGSDSQATFNISNGRIYFEPELYRGFQAGLNQIWGDDCSVNQLIITNASAPNFYNTDFLVEDDVFHASGLATGNTHVMLNVYGSSQYNPINPQNLWNMFVAFVDGVLYDGETLRTDVSDIKSAFYNNGGNFTNNIPTQDLFQYFRFTQSSGADYFGTAPTTGGSGTDATVRVRINPNNTYTVLGTDITGIGYIGGETLTVLGTDLGGATPTNDLTILIDSVDGDGRITAVSYLSGTGVYPWPPNYISDGSDDQYDSGNYINTNLAAEISYANGEPQTDSAAFGGGDYCVMYNQSFFCMVATGVSSSVTDLFYSGNLGFDGDGFLNWTGLRSNQDVVVNNNALYAYFDSEYLDGELTPTVGTTYNMVLDSAGINLDGFYAYNDTNTGDYFFGRNTDWRVESQSQLYVQSYNEMFIQTLVNQRGTGESGPALNVRAGTGSPGQQEINAVAGNGGTLNINGGDAGGSDGIDSLGNTGGSVNITGGLGTGNSQAGNVNLYGGEGANAGSINLYTDFGANSSGKVKINTYDGNTNKIWEFRPDGTTIVPTLTVDLHNGGNQAGQVLQFGDITQQVIITGPTPEVDSSAQRLIIQGQRGNGTGEGGDVYFWAGDADTNGGDIKIYAGDADNVSAGYGGYVNIEGGSGFDSGGYASIQGGQSSNGQGAYAQLVGGYGLSGGFANIVGGQGYAGPGGAVNITGGASGNGLAEYGNVNIGAGASTWAFDNTGNLVLPGNTFSVNYANGTQVTFGAAALGNVTFDDVTVQGVNQLNLSAGPDYTANLAYLQVRAGDVASHIHFDTGNNEAYDLIVGNDQKFVQVSSTGNIIMSSYDSNTNQYTWTLDTTGNLILADGNSIIRSVANSSLDPLNPNVSTMVLTPDPGYSSQSLVLDPTAPGHIHLRAPGANIDEPSANIFLGGEDSSFEVGYYNGSAPNVFIHSGGNTWTFDNTGNLTTPSNLVIGPSGFGTGTGFTQSDAPLLLGSLNANGRASIGWYENPTGPGNVVQVGLNDAVPGSMTVTTGDYANTTYLWDFDSTGNLTLPTGGALNTTGNILSNGYARFSGTFDESQASTAGLYLGYAGNTSRIMFGTGNTSQTLEIDNDGGTLRFYKPGTTLANLNTSGDFSTAGNITATGKIGYANGGTATQSGTGQGVTLNQLTGQITMFKSSWNAGDTEVFNISCNKVANADYVMAQTIGTAEASYFNTVAYPYTPLANSIRVQVTALETATTAPVVQFFIMKAATS